MGQLVTLANREQPEPKVELKPKPEPKPTNGMVEGFAVGFLMGWAAGLAKGSEPPPKSKRGGRRPGAGRPKGSRSKQSQPRPNVDADWASFGAQAVQPGIQTKIKAEGEFSEFSEHVFPAHSGKTGSGSYD